MNLRSLVGALTLGALAAVPVSADVIRERGYGRTRDGYRYGGTHRIGFDRGYEEGFEHGRKDAERRRDFNFWHDREYREGDRGYRRSMGPKHEYVRAFRAGYEQGYEDAFAPYRRGRNAHRRDRRDRDYGDYRDRDGRYYGRDNGYDYQRDGRHRHAGRSGWCSARHADREGGYDDYDRDGRIIREE